LSEAFAAAESCDVFFSIGTSNLVHPAASLPWVAAKHGALVAVVNVDMSGQAQSPNVVHLTGKAGDVLPALIQSAFGQSGDRQ
jgi:NAD-dependent deacetylase